jgi:D-alanyl-lipoteichoic acid acyltransferase DltB (MBOAT superfamily)
LLLNFGILAITKYTNFTIENINYILTSIGNENRLSFWTIALPMGISFYTFQTMSYIIDVYREKHPAETNFFKLALFVSFFPQLVQGPISRFSDLSKTLFKEHDFDYQNVKFGLQRIMWGFFKKMVLADRMLVAVNTLIRDPENYKGFYVLVVMLFYAYELYADFTGGIDITIGIAQVLGINVKENFERPYFSKSIAEFWRRWHITMGTWFKDYVFYPLSVSKRMLRLSKYSRKKFGDAIGKRIPVYLSTLIVWFTTGIWHGANWNFIVWGLMNGIVIIISLEFKPFYEWFHNKFDVADKLSFKIFQIVRTILLMSTLRLFDCYRDVPLTFKMVGTMFTVFNFNDIFNGTLMKLGLSVSDYFILIIGLLIMIGVSMEQRSGSLRIKISTFHPVIRKAIYLTAIVSIFIFGAYGVGYDSSQFIYNQF